VKACNMVTKHRKPDADNPDGSIVRVRGSLRVSKLQVVVNGEPTRIGRKRNDEGKLQRYAKKTGDFITRIKMKPRLRTKYTKPSYLTT
jgi:large subunit ribosomal protein L24